MDNIMYIYKMRVFCHCICNSSLITFCVGHSYVWLFNFHFLPIFDMADLYIFCYFPVIEISKSICWIRPAWQLCYTIHNHYILRLIYYILAFVSQMMLLFIILLSCKIYFFNYLLSCLYGICLKQTYMFLSFMKLI